MEDGVYGKSGRGGAGWEQMERFSPNVPPRTTSPTTTRALRSLSFGPGLASLLSGAGRLFRQGRESGAFQAIVWAEPVSGGSGRGVGWSGGGEAEAETIPSGGAGRAQCLPGEGRGLLGTVGWGEMWARDSC